MQHASSDRVVNLLQLASTLFVSCLMKFGSMTRVVLPAAGAGLHKEGGCKARFW